MAGARTLAVADRIHRESAMSAGTRFVVRNRETVDDQLRTLLDRFGDPASVDIKTGENDDFVAESSAGARTHRSSSEHVPFDLAHGAVGGLSPNISFQTGRAATSRRQLVAGSVSHSSEAGTLRTVRAVAR